jgi:hypothetical protein
VADVPAFIPPGYVQPDGLPLGYISLADALPAEDYSAPAAAAPNPYAQFDPPPAPAPDPLWWSCFSALADQFMAQQQTGADLRRTVSNQGALLNAQSHLIAALLRLIRKRIPDDEIDAALAAGVAGIEASLSSELVPVFRLGVQHVLAQAALVDGPAAPVH